MIRRTMLALSLSALALSACATGPEQALSDDEAAALEIAQIRTSTSGTIFETDAASELRNFVSADLTSALRREFADRTAGTGWTMVAEIDTLRLASGTATTVGADQSSMTGTLKLADPTGRVRASVPVTVTAGEAATSVRGAAVGVLFGRQGRYYRTLLDRFAREGRTRLLGADLPGQRIVRRTIN